MIQSIPCRGVFLVSEHPVVLLGIRAMVEAQADLRVAGVAGDVDSALTGLAETLPDIVVVDASLQRASRIALVERIRTRYSRTPVLALTSHEETAFARQLLQAGARGFILSCSAAEELIHAIRSILDGGLYRTGEALFNQFRQKAAVVDVRMRQDDGINRVRRERERAIVQFPLGLRALEKAAIDEDARMRRFNFVA